MERFWKWLMRANARGVFVCSVAALILVAGWWTWREFFPSGLRAAVLAGAGQKEVRRGLGLWELMQQMQSERLQVAADDPFLNPWAGDAQPFRPEMRWPRRTTRPQPVEPRVSPAPRKPDTVSLTYRGIFKRSDGKDMALIGDSKSGGSSFYSMGDQLHRVSVGQIGVEELEVVAGDGSTVTLKIGIPAVFEEGMHVE